MFAEKRIIIGSDDIAVLPAVLNGMKKTAGILHNIITVARPSDLLGIIKSIHPDLIILFFRNNRQVLAELETTAKSPGIPVLCLIKNTESEAEYHSGANIVFTYPLEQIGNEAYLHSRISSIFLLRNAYPNVVHGHSAPDSSRDLCLYVMELDQKVDVLLKIKDRITGLYPKVDDPTRVELISIVNAIKLSASNTELWEDFKLYFEESNPDFLLQLAKKYPFLTPVDLKYCCYLKMNMTNDDIKNIFGISLESVRTHKYRLKKKMALSKEDDLRKYLRSVG